MIKITCPVCKGAGEEVVIKGIKNDLIWYCGNCKNKKIVNIWNYISYLFRKIV